MSSIASVLRRGTPADVSGALAEASDVLRHTPGLDWADFHDEVLGTIMSNRDGDTLARMQAAIDMLHLGPLADVFDRAIAAGNAHLAQACLFLDDGTVTPQRMGTLFALDRSIVKSTLMAAPDLAANVSADHFKVLFIDPLTAPPSSGAVPSSAGGSRRVTSSTANPATTRALSELMDKFPGQAAEIAQASRNPDLWAKAFLVSRLPFPDAFVQSITWRIDPERSGELIAARPDAVDARLVTALVASRDWSALDHALKVAPQHRPHASALIELQKTTAHAGLDEYLPDPMDH